MFIESILKIAECPLQSWLNCWFFAKVFEINEENCQATIHKIHRNGHPHGHELAMRQWLEAQTKNQQKYSSLKGHLGLEIMSWMEKTIIDMCIIVTSIM